MEYILQDLHNLFQFLHLGDVGYWNWRIYMHGYIRFFFNFIDYRGTLRGIDVAPIPMICLYGYNANEDHRRLPV